MNTFEELFQLAQALSVPEHDEQRTVEWCDGGKRLGLARQQGGSYELFISGPKLRAERPLVERHLKHDRWSGKDDVEFEANRLVLPSGSQFLPIAAFLAEELLRNGVLVSVHAAFSRSEPLIEMALRRTALEEEALTGLMGELKFLLALLSVAQTPVQRAACLEAWKGYERSSRDFVFQGRADVEVKVTRGPRSSHQISSISQVDPKRAGDGWPLEQLYLLSIGLMPALSVKQVDALTLPRQVEGILLALGPSVEPTKRNEIQELFLGRLSKYGADSRLGYQHDEMSGWAAYNIPWLPRFWRVYDMNSDSLEVLRLSDVERRRLVAADSITFVANLPDEVPGEQNPRSDVESLASELVGLP